MRPAEILESFRIDVLPQHRAEMAYQCVGCGALYALDQLLYTCPSCRSLLRLKDKNFDALKSRTGEDWRRVFDLRRALLGEEWARGVFLFHEL
ncbi:MAG: threonine synthase, partial [Deltaproteobacteria bacterium]|nr:threonine synthase [Deltaproteobacteria bacterium]